MHLYNTISENPLVVRSGLRLCCIDTGAIAIHPIDTRIGLGPLLHSSKILTIQQGITRGVSFIGKSSAAWDLWVLTHWVVHQYGVITLKNRLPKQYLCSTSLTQSCPGQTQLGGFLYYSYVLLFQCRVLQSWHSTKDIIQMMWSCLINGMQLDIPHRIDSFVILLLRIVILNWIFSIMSCCGRLTTFSLLL